jgi:hypothetical protein
LPAANFGSRVQWTKGGTSLTSAVTNTARTSLESQANTARSRMTL